MSGRAPGESPSPPYLVRGRLHPLPEVEGVGDEGEGGAEGEGEGEGVGVRAGGGWAGSSTGSGGLLGMGSPSPPYLVRGRLFDSGRAPACAGEEGESPSPRIKYGAGSQSSP